MGYALAKCAARRGAEVTLVTGPTALPPPLFAETVPVTTAEEMYQAVTSRAAQQDAVIMAAAVADYRPTEIAAEKQKKKDGDAVIPLTRTKDILAYLGQHKPEGQFLCGFSMETEHMLENSRAKLEKKHLDMICANNLKVDGAGFGTDTNVVTLIRKHSEQELPLQSKEMVSHAILDVIADACSENAWEATNETKMAYDILPGLAAGRISAERLCRAGECRCTLCRIWL